MNIDRTGALALALVLTTATLCLAPPARAASAAEFTGRLLTADGVTPLSDAAIILLDLEKRTEHRSEPTRDNGGFALEVPPGEYTIVIETSEGAYLATEGLVLAAGANQPLLLALSGDRPATPPPGLAAKGGGWPTWVKWVVVGVVVVIGAVVVNEVTDDGEAPTSPF